TRPATRACNPGSSCTPPGRACGRAALPDRRTGRATSFPGRLRAIAGGLAFAVTRERRLQGRQGQALQALVLLPLILAQFTAEVLANQLRAPLVHSAPLCRSWLGE